MVGYVGFSLCCVLSLIITEYHVAGINVLLCDDPGKPINAVRHFTHDFNVGSTVTFTCEAGYHMETGGNTHTMLCEDKNGAAIWNAAKSKCIPIVCEKPPTVSNAEVDGNSFDYEAVVTYTCNDGYETKDSTQSMTSTCSHTGEWEPTPTACVALHCKQPESIHNARRDGDVFTFKQRITYTCNEGYHIVRGVPTLFCGSAGTWQGQYPQCDQIDCKSPPMIDNAGRSMTGTGYLSSVTYTCKDGFHRDPTAGPLTRICGLDSSWSKPEPVCLGMLCNDPGEVAHSNRNSSLGELTFRYPEEIHYYCHIGYVLDLQSGASQVACQTNGEYDLDPPTCTIVRCKDTTASNNVELLEDTNVYGTVRTYKCIEGHKLVSGSLSRTCLETATYDSDPPQCERVDCGMPNQVNHSQRVFDNGTRYKDIITYTCGTGYEAEDSGGKTQVALFCQQNANWSRATPVCTRVSCSPADVGEGSVVQNPEDHYYGDTAEYGCLVGHEHFTGDQTRLCGVDKIWTGVAYGCNRTSCGDPGLRDHATRQGDSFLYADRLLYECSPGYEVTAGDSVLVCSDTKNWNGKKPTCSRISCGRPDDVTSATYVGDDFLYEDEVSYTCDHGYEWKAGSGALNRTCKDTGFWSKSPICERVSCGVPGDGNGTMKLGNGHQLGDVVNYTCDVGHWRKGQQWGAINCTADRQWIGERIACQPVVCPDPGPGENATRSSDSFVYDSILKFTCIEGHRLPNGIDSIICLPSQKWNNPTPACSPIPGFLPPPKVEKVVKMVDAKGSDTIGMIGLGLVVFELFVILIIDLPKLWADMRIMRRNLGPLFSKLSVRLTAYRARMKKERPTSLTSLRSGASKKTKKKKKKNKRKKAKKETTYELMDEGDGTKKKAPPKRGVICSD